MAVTPLRKQYLRVKEKYPGAIVFFRLGDFYETFDEDAKVAARELDVVLTSREMGKGQRVPMAGIPHHALDNYLAKLINRGHKVAICEQLSPPGKGLVERDVIRVVTPGTVVEPNLLASKNNNYLASLVVAGEEAGIAYVDITTSEFATTQLPIERVMPELDRLQPSEVLIPEHAEGCAQLPLTVTRLWLCPPTASHNSCRRVDTLCQGNTKGNSAPAKQTCYLLYRFFHDSGWTDHPQPGAISGR